MKRIELTEEMIRDLLFVCWENQDNETLRKLGNILEQKVENIVKHEEYSKRFSAEKKEP